MVRAKFRLTKITHVDWNKEVRVFEFSAVSDSKTEENKRFTKYTPDGYLKMMVDNPAASNQFELGKEYYLDFSIAE